MKSTLEIAGRKGEWFIHDPQGRLEDDCGPYTTKEEAADDMRGLERFFRYEVGRKPSRPVAVVQAAPVGFLF